MAPGKQIHVMLVDDSAVIRGALTKTLEEDPAIHVVSSMSNGEMAVSAVERRRPHVVIMDIEMPVMDGLTALPKILEKCPQTKVIMFSSLTEKGASTTLKALSLGAVECIVKPSSGQNTGPGSPFQRQLVELIKNLVPDEVRVPSSSESSVSKRIAPAPPPKSLTPVTLHDDSQAYTGKPSLLAIGSSTGGPQALFKVIKNFHGFDIPIVLTQHMPSTFTKILAQHITQHTGLIAHEGEEGMPLEPGKVYVAPGGFHMHLVQDSGKTVIHLDNGPPENFCKPAVDPMLRTAQKIYGKKILCVILTGMGNDGLNAGKDLVKAGGRLIAQDEATSVVWGMPGAVAQAGICSAVLPVDEIGPWVRKAVMG